MFTVGIGSVTKTIGNVADQGNGIPQSGVWIPGSTGGDFKVVTGTPINVSFQRFGGFVRAKALPAEGPLRSPREEPRTESHSVSGWCPWLTGLFAKRPSEPRRPAYHRRSSIVFSGEPYDEASRIFKAEGPEDELDTDQDANSPISPSTDVQMGTTCNTGQINQVHFGEQVASWRSVIKRYTTSENVRDTTPFSYQFPDALAFSTSGTILHWVTRGYLGYRGALRHKFFVLQGSVTAATIQRLNHAVTHSIDYGPSEPSIGFNGGAYEYVALTGVFDAEVPWYSNLRFHPSRKDTTYQNSNLGLENTWTRIDVVGPDEEDCVLMHTVAAAEDFSCHMFHGVPTLRLIPPPSVVVTPV
jgi:hypothetical protein